MGQYYKFINIDKKEVCKKSCHGLKLMEHSYVGNDYCDTVLKLLSNEWKGDRILHIGDYAEPNDSSNTRKIISKLTNEFNLNYTLYEYANTFNIVDSKCNDNIRYVYDLDKKEYVDLYKQPIQGYWIDNGVVYPNKINSFALLTGCGNEQGGGDYYFINKKAVGCWAGDKFISSTVPLKEYDKFKEKNLIFNERKNEYQKMKKYNLFTKDKIINDELKILQETIEYYNKWDKLPDKLKINDDCLTDREKEVFPEKLNRFVYMEKSIIKKYMKKDGEDKCLEN